MATKIEWVKNPDGTQGEVWNVVHGCTKVSPGCYNCWSIQEAWMRSFNPNTKISGPLKGVVARLGLDGGLKWTGQIVTRNDRLNKPLHWRKPRTIFVCSQADLFHEKIPDEFIQEVFWMMEEAYWHKYLILTKRPERMYEFITGANSLAHIPVLNLWVGVSVEDQQRADERIPWLLKTPAMLRIVSYEPALGSIDFTHIHYDGKLLGVNCLTGHDYYCGKKESIFAGNKIGWVILGCESGTKRRPFNYDWAQQTRFHCKKFGIPFFFKQAPVDGKVIHMPLLYGKTWDQIPEVK